MKQPKALRIDKPGEVQLFSDTFFKDSIRFLRIC